MSCTRKLRQYRTAINWSSLTDFMMAEMKAKTSKGETNWLFCTSQYPRDVDFASSLADRGCSARQVRASGVIATSQKKHNMRSMYTDVPIFLAQKNTKNVTKRHGFYF